MTNKFIMATVCQTCASTVFQIINGKSICSVCNNELEEFVTRQNETDIRPNQSNVIGHGTSNLNKFTSWEFYNRILLGLTNELIILGADENLRDVVMTLWFKYLLKKEVVSDDPDALPKLSLNYKNMDAEIIYGFKKRKRVVRNKLVLDDLNEEDKKKAKNKRMKKLAVEQALNEKEHDEVHQSMSDKTIADIGTQEDNIPMEVNQTDYDLLLKHMSEDHLKLHLEDLNDKMSCHCIKNKNMRSNKNFLKAHLSKNTLYQLLYIGLLIIKSDVQCGDLLRFIVNGHLSYNSIEHLLPLEMVKSHKNYRWNRDATPVKKEFLTKAWDLVDYIQVRKYIPMQNLPDLCKRYCKELNLPDEIQLFSLNLMSKSQPKLAGKIKDHEARAMCFIVFTLKLLFSFDSVTEYKFSKFAELLDDKCKMFNIIKWLEFIKCRRKVLAKYHLPTQLAKSSTDINHNNVIDMLESYPPAKTKTNKTTEEIVMLRMLEDLKRRINRKRSAPMFEPTLTPMQHYIEQILDTGKLDGSCLLNLLQQDFTWYSLDYLTNTEKYAHVKLIMRNANDNINLVPIIMKRVPPTRATVECQLVDGPTPRGQDLRSVNKKPLVAKIKKDRSAYCMPVRDKMIGEDAESFPSYKEHFAPEKRFWLLMGHKIDQDDSLAKEYFKHLPYNFRLIIEECAYMLQTTPANFCQEYLYFEAYMCFTLKTSNPTKMLTTIGNKLHYNTINQHAQNNW